MRSLMIVTFSTVLIGCNILHGEPGAQDVVGVWRVSDQKCLAAVTLDAAPFAPMTLHLKADKSLLVEGVPAGFFSRPSTTGTYAGNWKLLPRENQEYYSTLLLEFYGPQQATLFFSDAIVMGGGSPYTIQFYSSAPQGCVVFTKTTAAPG